jgi:predicted P-loop ATPase/GTPase
MYITLLLKKLFNKEDMHFYQCDVSYYNGEMIQGVATVIPDLEIHDVSNYYSPRNFKKVVNVPGESGETNLTYTSKPNNI